MMCLFLFVAIISQDLSVTWTVGTFARVPPELKEGRYKTNQESVMYKLITLLLIAASSRTIQCLVTEYRCTGGTRLDRKCRFMDLVYDTIDNTFIIGSHNQSDDTRLDIRTGLGMTSYVSVKQSKLQLPRGSFCIIPSPTYFHTPHKIKSYGHMMRDNWHQIALNMGNEVMKVVLLTDEGVSRAASHYSAYVTPSLMTMRDMKMYGRCTEKRYIVFKKSRMGNGDRDMRTSSKCTSKDVRKQRDLVMNNMGVQPSHSEKLRITILDKTLGDKRRIINVGEITASLRHKFPNMIIKPMLFLAMNATRNLQTIVDTDILITNVGSPSFRLLHLQDNARVIMVGAPSIKVQGSNVKLDRPFDEFDDCWKSFTHIRFHKYVVDDQSEVFCRFRRHDSMGSETTYVRDSDIKLNVDKVVGIVHEILKTM